MFSEEPAGAGLGVIAHGEGGLEVVGIDSGSFVEDVVDHGELKQVGCVSDEDAVQKADVFLVIKFVIDFFPEGIGGESSIETEGFVGISESLTKDFFKGNNDIRMVIPVQIFSVWEEFAAFGSAPEDTVGEAV